MTKNSINCETSGGRECAYKTLSGKNVLGLRTEAEAHGVEWHHCAGHCAGREIIAFFPKNDDEEEAIDRLAALLATKNLEDAAKKAELKKEGLPTSKAALWRILEKEGKQDVGFGGTPYKNGKFGPFVPSFGDPDGFYFFPSQAIAAIAKEKL